VVDREWSGSEWIIYRRTSTRFYPRDDDSQYIVSLPGFQVVRDAADTLLARQLYYYDGETNVTIPPANGVLTATKTQIDDTHYRDVVYTYDSWGNQESVTQYSAYSNDIWAFPSAPFAQTTTTTYDEIYHTYPVSTSNAEGHTVSWEYDEALGLPVSETGLNGGITTADYDAFGRLTEITRPGDTDTISITYYDSASPYEVEITERLDADTTTTSRRFYDGLGRKIQTQADDVELDVGTYDVLVDMTYDEYGRLVEQTVPYYPDQYGQNDPPATITTYDILSRPEIVTAPDNTTVSYDYDDLLVEVTDAKDRTTTQHMDVWGRLVLVETPAGPSASYEYDELDRLVEVTSGGAETTIAYDMSGRKTSMDDADMGTWSYQYDALGNLTQQSDARGCITELDYDSLNRLTDKDFSGPGECDDTPDIDFTYDEGSYGLGQRTHMDDGSGSTDWTYDQRGRLIKEEKDIDGVGAFVTEWTYNTANQITSMIYPAGPDSQESGEVVTYDYLPQGAFDSLSGDATYVNSTSYDEAGRLTSRTLGDGLLETSYAYYTWTAMGGRLQQTITERLGDETILQNMEYSYDAVGNVEWIKDRVAGSQQTPQTQSFTYDDLDRLTGAVVTDGSGGLYDESYSYDPTSGNLASKAGVNYGYQGAQPHAVTHLDDVERFTYDAVGNMDSRKVGTETTALTYDAESRLIEAGPYQGTPDHEFIYDGDGSRVLTIVDGVTTAYPGNHYEYEVGSDIARQYYGVGGTMRVSGDPEPSNNGVFYMLGDHLGSTSITVDESGGVVAELRYKAWGETRYANGNTPTTWRYTGQRQEEGLGLYYYRARWYDPYLNRFIQPDTILPNPTNPQSYNRYTYVNNNPIRYNDPTGHYVPSEVCKMAGSDKLPHCESVYNEPIVADPSSHCENNTACMAAYECTILWVWYF